jgi:hypothetical protein
VTYDPDRPDILRKRDDSLSGAMVGGIAVGLLILFGIAFYVLGSGNRDIAATDTPPAEQPSTTGRGGPATMPSRDQRVPMPAPMPKSPQQ